MAEGVVDDISHEGLRLILREEGVSFQVIKTYKQSTDPHFEAKENTGARALRNRRWEEEIEEEGPDRRHLHGRVRAAEPKTSLNVSILGPLRPYNSRPLQLRAPRLA